MAHHLAKRRRLVLLQGHHTVHERQQGGLHVRLREANATRGRRVQQRLQHSAHAQPHASRALHRVHEHSQHGRPCTALLQCIARWRTGNSGHGVRRDHGSLHLQRAGASERRDDSRQCAGLSRASHAPPAHLRGSCWVQEHTGGADGHLQHVPARDAAIANEDNFSHAKRVPTCDSHSHPTLNTCPPWGAWRAHTAS